MAALGCKYIVLDHLSIVVSDQSGDERKQLDEISTKLKTLCMEANIALVAVIHQNRQGQIRGTAGVEQLANIVLRWNETSQPQTRGVEMSLRFGSRRIGFVVGPDPLAGYSTTTSRAGCKNSTKAL
jgi:predicted ATP-dependent serine protease